MSDDPKTTDLPDWYDRSHCSPEERAAREVVDKIGRRGYIAAGANLTFMAMLVEHAILGRGLARWRGANWQPAVTAPKDRIFLAWNGKEIFFGEYLHGKFFTSRGQSGRSAPPMTHWMPLPEPPK